MRFFKNEKTILTLIRYGAIIMVIFSSFVITQIFIKQKIEYLNVEIKDMKEYYINHNKTMVKNLVEKIESFIKVEKELSQIKLKSHIKEEVYEAHKIALSTYEEYSKKNYSKDEILNHIKRRMADISFNDDRGYIFFIDITGKILLHKYKKFEGNSLIDKNDINTHPFVKNIIKTIKNKTEVYDEYHWYKGIDKTKTFKKIGFYKYFEPLGIVIGAADYLEDYEKEVQESVLEKVNKLKFKKPEYIFIYDIKGNYLASPKKGFLGTNIYNIKNEDTKQSLISAMNFAKKNKEGFLGYNDAIALDENIKSNEKISYVKYLDDWQWVVSSGFYLEELNSKIIKKVKFLQQLNKDAANKIIIVSTIITGILIVLSFYLSNLLDDIFKTYKRRIDSQMQKTLNKEKLLIQQSKMAIMGEMIGNIAHQWKQPLSLISMSNSMIRVGQENEGFVTKEELTNAVDNIDNSVKHLSQTIDDFRRFFRPDKAKGYFFIDDLLNKTFKLIKPQLESSNISIVCENENVELFGYENEVLQVLINILKNAKDELVKLKNSSQNKYIFLNAYKENNEFIISIKDNAGGVPLEIINKIFEAYFTTKSESDGTGIGLYMCKQIIEGMNGRIEVSNEEFSYNDKNYKGANFKIYFPTKS